MLNQPYHPRPYLVAKDGGKMDILKSTITNMGFKVFKRRKRIHLIIRGSIIFY